MLARWAARPYPWTMATVIRTPTLLLALTLCLVAPIAPPAQAGGGPLTIGPSFVETVTPCSPQAHYVRTYRNSDGQWVKGRCVPNVPGPNVSAPLLPAQK